MIHSIKVKNFYSISEEQSMSFVADGRTPENNSYLTIQSTDIKVSKVNMIIGANASGKTNLLKAIGFVGWLLGSSFNTMPDSGLPYKRFFDSKESSKIEVVFSIGEIIYTYKVEFNPERIITESLELNQLVNTRRTDKKIFTRSFVNTKNLTLNKYKFEGDNFDSKLFANAPLVLDRKNSSVLAIGLQFNNKFSIEIANYWMGLSSNIFEGGYLDTDENTELLNNMILWYHNPKQKLNIEKVLKKFDLGFDSIQYDTVKNGNNLRFESVQEVHNFGGKKYTNEFKYSSTGTKKLINIIKHVLFAISTGRPVILDEIEAYMHPDILREIIDMFIDDEVNSQIIFTSHSHIIMDKLDKNQIFLTEKNPKNGATEVFGLDTINGVRSDDNFYNKYIAGAYGAMPKLM
jgi:uncharacterized protein